MSNSNNFVDCIVALPRISGLEPENATNKRNGIICEEISFTCAYCDKLFFLKNDLKTHIQQHMKNDKKLKCQLCNIGFSRKTYLAEHNCIHNGQKPHSCYYCNKSFSLRCNLVRHVRIHTGEKRFSCDMCNNSFILKKNLIEHKRTHTGEKPFECPSCDWTFGRRSSLVRHIRTHTGQKEFVCSICNKSFAWKYYLQRHMQTHLTTKARPTRATSKSSESIQQPKKFNVKSVRIITLLKLELIY